MSKIFGNWFKGNKGVQLCACSHFSGYTNNLFTCRLTYLAPFARAQFLVKLGEQRLTYWDLDVSFFFLSFFILPAQPQDPVSYLFLLSSSSSSYTVAVCDCVFHLYDFFLLLSTLQRLISLTCLDWFWPNLVPSTPTPSQTWPWGQRSRRGHRGQKGNFH